MKNDNLLDFWIKRKQTLSSKCLFLLNKMVELRESNPDLLNAIQALSQLSYNPIQETIIRA